jgi:hypothetical protein
VYIYLYIFREVVMPTYQGIVLDQGGAVYNVNAYEGSIQAALDAAVLAGRGIAFVPPGIYNITNPILLEGKQDISLIGAGPNLTQLVQANDQGVIIVRDNGSQPSNRIQIQSMWIGISEGTPRTGGAGISLSSRIATPLDTMLVRDIILQNVPYPFVCDNVHQSTFEAIRVVTNIADAVKGVCCLVKNSNSIRIKSLLILPVISPATKYPFPGLQIEADCDTVIITNSEIADSRVQGVILTGGTSGPRLVRLDNVYVELCQDSGFYVENGRDVRLLGCHAAVNNGNGFAVLAGNSVTITDSLSLQNKQHGFLISGGTGVKIEGCTASNNSQLQDNTYSGCYVGNTQTVSGVRVIGNKFGNFIFSSPNQQKYGLVLAANTSYIIATSNDLMSNKTSGLLNASTGPGIIVQNNLT